MHRALLGLAAGAAVIASPLCPAAAQSFTSSGLNSFSGSRDIHVLVPNTPGNARLGAPGRDGRHRRDGRDDRVGDNSAGWAYSGYNDYGDYDANRSFAEDKWNDWWHDRPDRAFPRWMSRNQNCQRPWYSGDVLTC
jgi:hypothetical protein